MVIWFTYIWLNAFLGFKQKQVEANAQKTVLTDVRNQFAQSLESSQKSADFQVFLLTRPDKDLPIVSAYLSTAQMAEAYLSGKPYLHASKLYNARKLMEQSISQAPNDYEIRFLRFSIESRLPSYLAFGLHIEEDIMVIEKQAVWASAYDLDFFGFMVEQIEKSGKVQKSTIDNLKKHLPPNLNPSETINNSPIIWKW